MQLTEMIWFPDLNSLGGITHFYPLMLLYSAKNFILQSFLQELIDDKNSDMVIAVDSKASGRKIKTNFISSAKKNGVPS